MNSGSALRVLGRPFGRFVTPHGLRVSNDTNPVSHKGAPVTRPRLPRTGRSRPGAIVEPQPPVRRIECLPTFNSIKSIKRL